MSTPIWGVYWGRRRGRRRRGGKTRDGAGDMVELNARSDDSMGEEGDCTGVARCHSNMLVGHQAVKLDDSNRKYQDQGMTTSRGDRCWRRSEQRVWCFSTSSSCKFGVDCRFFGDDSTMRWWAEWEFGCRGFSRFFRGRSAEFWQFGNANKVCCWTVHKRIRSWCVCQLIAVF